MPGVIQGPQRQYYKPAWIKDYLNREHVLPGGAKVDPTQFPREDSVVVTVATGGVAIGATSIPVTALSGQVLYGTPLRFVGGQLAYVTATAPAGATALTVDTLAWNIPAGSTALFRGTGRVYVSSGTVIGRTFVERNAGTPFGVADDGDTTDGEVYLLVHDIDDALWNNDADLYRWGSLVDEAHLPGWGSLSTAIQDYIRAHYQCMRGAD